MNKTAAITLRMADVRGLRMQASGLETLRALAGSGARALGHDLTADYAFLAADCSSAYKGTLREVVRFFVLLPGVALIDFDVVVPADAQTTVSWTLEGMPRPELVTSIPRPPDTGLLHVIWLSPPRPIKAIDSIDMAGVRVGNRVVAFYTETRMARSAVSFDVDGTGTLKFLLAGLAPGEWEVWFAGMLEIPDAEVQPEAGTLAFDGKAGGYFFRRLGS